MKLVCPYTFNRRVAIFILCYCSNVEIRFVITVYAPKCSWHIHEKHYE